MKGGRQNASHMSRRACSVFLAAGLSAIAPALACEGDNVLFQDNFATTDAGWAFYDKDTTKIGNGSLKLRPEPGRRAFIVYRADLYERADVCVDVAGGDGSTVPAGSAGLIFAWEDYAGFYYFWVSPRNGTAGVERWSDTAHKWLEPVPARKVDNIKSALGQKNRLRVASSGAHAAAYLNQQLVVEFNIKEPEIGGFIGLEAVRLDDDPAEWTFENFRITDLPK